MRKIIKLLMITIVSFFFSSGVFGSSYSTIKLDTPSGYSTEGWLYEIEGNKKETAIVFLHGKRSNPGLDHYDQFISKMSDLGYQVIAPLMPWSQMRS